MHAEENRLRPFIEPTKQFIVPLFQRFYVWDKPYWNTLWTDILELIADEDDQRTHFLGSIVVIPAAKSSPSLPKFVVIDGQQPLATLLVLLAALRDRARQGGDDHLADEIEQTLLVNKFKRGDEHDKLLLSQDDRLAFQHLLRAQTPRPDHRLCQCYAFFDKKLAARDAPDLAALFGAVADRLSVVTIILAASDNPYLVFESLNFKGHQVTEADLIRNYLPESVTVLGQTVPVKSWREVLSATLETLAGAEPAKFARLPDRFPSYLATSPQGFRAPKPLASGYFIETHLGAASIHRFCQRAVATLELPPEAWTVQVKPPAADTP